MGSVHILIILGTLLMVCMLSLSAQGYMQEDHIQLRFSREECNNCDTCNALSALLNLEDPMYDPQAAEAPPAPAPNPVSSNLGSRSEPLYPFYTAITASGNKITPGKIPLTGAEVKNSWAIGNSEDTACLGLVDFNNFRINLVDVINILDYKIRQILAVPKPDCGSSTTDTYRNNLVNTYDHWGPEFKISFSFMLHSKPEDWRNFIHLTSNDRDCCDSGTRLPGVFFKDDFLHLTYANGGEQKWFDYGPLETDKWYDVIIEQKKVDVDRATFTLMVEGAVIWQLDTIPNQYPNVKFYNSDPWYQSLDDDIFVQGLNIHNGPGGATARLSPINGQPELFYNNKWSPICGHWFWDNNYGADLFCKEVYGSVSSGIITSTKNTLTLDSEGLLIGTCTANDVDLTQCTGGSNWDQEKANTYCSAGRQDAGIKISCGIP